MYFKMRATCITADTPVCTNVRKNNRYIKFVSLAWKIHVCILITVYADYTGMNYDDRTFTHKDQGLNKVTNCINKRPVVHIFKGCLRACSLRKFENYRTLNKRFPVIRGLN